MICVDANVLIAALDASDPFHLAASEVLVDRGPAVALNLTIAEALIRPTRDGRDEIARELLDEYGVVSSTITDDVAATATHLRARHGNRNFPLLDAVVVAHGIVHGLPVITADAKWPIVPEATIEVLATIGDDDAPT